MWIYCDVAEEPVEKGGGLWNDEQGFWAYITDSLARLAKSGG